MSFFYLNQFELKTKLFPLCVQLFPSFQSFQKPFIECKHSVQHSFWHYGNGKVLQIKSFFNVKVCKKPEPLNSNDHMTYLLYSSIVAVVAFHNPQCKCFEAGGEVYLRDFCLILSIFHFCFRKFYNGKSICNTNKIKHTIFIHDRVGCILCSLGEKYSAVVSTYANPSHVITPTGNMHHRAENPLHKITIFCIVCVHIYFLAFW